MNKSINLGLNLGTPEAVFDYETHLNKNWEIIDEQLAEKAQFIDNFPIQIPEVDDTGRFQRAVNSGYNILLKYKGVYTVDTVRFMTSGVTLFGNEATVNAKSVTSNMFLIGSNEADGFIKVNTIKIYSLNFVGVQNSWNTSEVSSGVNIKGNLLERGSGCENILVEKCSFTKLTFGIIGTGATGLEIRDNHTKDLYYCQPLSAGGYGVLTQTCFDVTIENNTFIGGVGDRHAIYISNAQPNIKQGENTTIKNNKIFWTNTERKTGFETAIAIRSIKGLVIDSNFIDGGFGGIDLTPSNGDIENVKIINNDITGTRTSGTTERGGISFQTNATYKVKNVTIDNNMLEGVTNYVHGISPTKGENVKITRNTVKVTGAQSNVIPIFNNDDVQVDGNTFVGVSSNIGIRYFGTNSKIKVGINSFKGFIQNEFEGTYISDFKHSYSRQARVTSNGSGTITISTDTEKILTSVTSNTQGFSITFSNLCNVALGEVSIIPMGAVGVYFFNRLNPSTNVIEIGIKDFAGVDKPLANTALTFMIVINK